MAEAADDLANACPSALPATPPARLKAISMRLDAMQQTLKAELNDLGDSDQYVDDELALLAE